MKRAANEDPEGGSEEKRQRLEKARAIWVRNYKRAFSELTENDEKALDIMFEFVEVHKSDRSKEQELLEGLDALDSKFARDFAEKFREKFRKMDNPSPDVWAHSSDSSDSSGDETETDINE